MENVRDVLQKMAWPGWVRSARPENFRMYYKMYHFFVKILTDVSSILLISAFWKSDTFCDTFCFKFGDTFCFKFGDTFCFNSAGAQNPAARMHQRLDLASFWEGSCGGTASHENPKTVMFCISGPWSYGKRSRRLAKNGLAGLGQVGAPPDFLHVSQHATLFY